MADPGIAGFDNFGSRRDISLVFEIEREVGTFYRDPEDDVFDEDGLDLPSPAAEDDGNVDTAGVNDPAPEDAGNGIQVSPTQVLSPKRVMFPEAMQTPRSPTALQQDTASKRERRKSAPSTNTSPMRPAYRPTVETRLRRNSSVVEPSPLARLFAARGSADEGSKIERLRERRQSLVSTVLPNSSSLPALSNMMSPTQLRGRHGRKLSQPAASSSGATSSSVSHRLSLPSKPPIAPIEEGKTSSFPSGDQSRHDNGASLELGVSPMNVDHAPAELPSVEQVARQAVEESHGAGKASEVEERLANKPADETGVESGVLDRLQGIEERQQRIEELLSQLVRAQAATGT